MATVAQLNAQIGLDMQPLIAGAAKTTTAMQQVGDSIAAAMEPATIAVNDTIAAVENLAVETATAFESVGAFAAEAGTNMEVFSEEVVAATVEAEQGIASMYQGLDNLIALQSRLPASSVNFQELGAAIDTLTLQIEALEAAEVTQISELEIMAAAADTALASILALDAAEEAAVQQAIQLAVAEKEAGLFMANSAQAAAALAQKEQAATVAALELAAATKEAGSFTRSSVTATAQATATNTSAKTASGNLTTSLDGLSKAYNLVRQAAQILPGIGIAGIFGLIFQGAALAAQQIGLFGSKANEVIPILEKLKKESQDFQDSLSKVQESAVSTGIKLQSFVDVAKDGELPLAQRNEALKQANKILGEHGEKLTLVNIYTKAVTDEVNNFTTALIAQAVAAKYADQIADQIIKNKNLLKEYTAAQQHLNDISNQRFTDGVFSTPYADAVKKVNDLALEYNNRLGSIAGLFKDLNEETRLAVANFTAVGDKGKPAVDKVGNSLQEMVKDLQYLNQRGELLNLSNVQVTHEYIARINEEINTLLKEGVQFDDIKIKQLQVQVESLRFEIDPNDIEKTDALAKLLPKNPILINPNEAVDRQLNIADALTKQLQDKQLANKKKNEQQSLKDTALYLQKEAKLYEAIGNEIKNAFSGVFTDLFTKGKLSFEGLAQSMEKLLANLAATAAEAAILSLILSSITGGTTTGVDIAKGFGASGTGFGAIFGALFGHADGGVFMGPTLLGNHVFGEAGPEAVLPLNGNMDKIFGGNNRAPVVMDVVLKGNDLVLVQNRQNRYNRRNYGNFDNG
jgi:hypothetical protein